MEKEEQKTRAEDTTVETATPATTADTGTAAAQEDNASVGLDAETQKLAEEIDQEFSADLLEEERIVEALLFTMGRSVGLDEIATALNAGKKIAHGDQAAREALPDGRGSGLLSGTHPCGEAAEEAGTDRRRDGNPVHHRL